VKMKSPPTGTAGVRHTALRAWLEANKAVWHNAGKYGTADIEGYVINGHVVYVLHNAEGNGWELLVPASSKNSIPATLRAAEIACGLG
jgi:hypothetical protein